MEIDHYEEENDLVRKLFDLEEVIDFQMKHDVQITRGDDWLYMCYIGKEVYATGLTTMGALVIGIKQFKKHTERQNDG